MGDGVDGDALRAAATSENLPVLFAGFRHPDEIPIWIGACDLLSLPSHAEGTPNVLGATLAGLRACFEDVVRERAATGDGQLSLVEGAPLVRPDALPDGIHPGDDGHRALAARLGPILARAARRL